MTHTQPGTESYRFSADALRAIITLTMEVVALATCAFTIGYVHGVGTWSHRALNGALCTAVTLAVLTLIVIVVALSVRVANRGQVR